MHLRGRLFDHGKADAAAARGVLPRGVGAVAEVEDLFQLRRVHARAVVCDRDADVFGGHFRRDDGVARAVFPAVVEQIGDVAREQLPVGQDPALRQLAEPDIERFRVAAVHDALERPGNVQRDKVGGRFVKIELRKREQPVHERLELRFLGVDRLQIARPRRFILRHAVEQPLRVGADGGQRAFEVVRHARDQLLPLLLLAALRVERGFEPRGHGVHRVARGFEFILGCIADGAFQIAAADAFDAGHQRLQRRGDVPEQAARQVEVRKRDRGQQRQDHRPGVDGGEGLRTGERRLQLLAGLMQGRERQPQPGQPHPLEKQKRKPAAEQQQDRRDRDRDQDHHKIRARKAPADRHKNAPPAICCDQYSISRAES